MNTAYLKKQPRWIAVLAAVLVMGLSSCCASGKAVEIPNVSGYSDDGAQSASAPSPSASALPTHSGLTDMGIPTAPSPSPEPTERPIRREILDARAEYGNDDIVGYLDIPGTSIQYYVTQTEDNDFYIDHDVRKKASNAGWIFLDYENDFSRQDKNTIIYGHNMNAKIMFHELRNFQKEDFAKNHCYLRLMTLYEELVFEVFAVFRADVGENGFHYNLVYITDEEFGGIVASINEKSMIDFGADVTADDRILILSTCTNLPDDSRLAVAGRYTG